MYRSSLRAAAEPREMIQCDRCSEHFEAGSYGPHVRNSPHSAHDPERSFKVDTEGKIHHNVNSGTPQM